MVICQGCGQSFALPAGYTRNKIQCTNCGVICAVEADAARGEGKGKRAAPARARPAPATPFDDDDGEVLAEGMLAEPTAAPLFDEEPAAPPVAPTRAKPGKEPDERVHCRRCGRLIRRQRECPSCDREAEQSPVAEVPARPGGMPLSLELDDVPDLPSEEEEEDSPYVLADKDIASCRNCRKDMAPGAVICTQCGFDTRTRKKAKRTYEPIARQWETDQSMRQRLGWLGIAWMVHVGLALLWLAAGHGVWPFVVSWPLLTGMLIFILGTYDRIEITRDTRGRVQLTRTWRFAFFPLTPVLIEVRGFEGVTTGTWQDAGIIEWLIFGCLLFSGIVPGFVWWYNAIHKPHFHVALAVDHGHPEVYVYRGQNEQQMKEIADVLMQASGLRHLA